MHHTLFTAKMSALITHACQRTHTRTHKLRALTRAIKQSRNAKKRAHALHQPTAPHRTAYALNIVDGATNYMEVYYLKDKSSALVLDALQRFLKRNQSYLPKDNRIVRWHTDNGGEFISHDLNEFCEEFAVRRSYSIPYAPPQNAHAERMWGILLRPMRIMLAESRVHESFWTFAMDHACMLHNRLPSTKLAGERSPYQAKYTMPPDVSKIRVWGCTCWYFVPEHERTSKISPRALPAVHLGNDPDRNGYIVYVPELNRITSACHVNFQERKFLEFSSSGVVNQPKSIRRLRSNVELNQHQPSGLPPGPHYDEPRDADLDPDNRDDNNPDNTQDNNETHEETCNEPRCTLSKHPWGTGLLVHQS